MTSQSRGLARSSLAASWVSALIGVDRTSLSVADLTSIQFRVRFLIGIRFGLQVVPEGCVPLAIFDAGCQTIQEERLGDTFLSSGGSSEWHRAGSVICL